MRLKNRIYTTKCQMLKAVALAAVVSSMAACTKGGSISSTTASSSISGSVAVSAVYPTSQGASWTPIVSANRFFIKGLQLTITGTCTPGINTIQVNEGGANYSDLGNCSADGFWTFTHTYTAVTQEGDKTLTLNAYDVTGLIIANTTITEQVRIDNTAPAMAVVTAPASTPFLYSSASDQFQLKGNCVADVDHLTLTGPGVTPSPAILACGGGQWNYTVTLTPEASQSYTVYTWDLAGNQSPGVVTTINYTPVLNLTMGNYSGGHTTDSSGSNDTLESSSYITPSFSTDIPTSFVYYTGFNYIINQERAQ